LVPRITKTESPQPGGFEGFLVIPEVFDQDDLADSECHDLTDSHFRLDPRLLAGRVRSYSQNHSPTTCVDQILDHRVVAIVSANPL
jgi:hypothetical protein